ncbi:MAG: glutathione S-transferase family protein [Deltaproteobacteria bacterium]|nr:glutathione S-transferase family protein [Deltaproteobacteria bacterium]
MKLIGMFDSPYVRRVAISMRLLDLPFEHLNWSIGKDIDRVKQFNPLGQVPTLVLDDGDVVIDSIAILDYLDDRVGPERALLPRTGDARRRILGASMLAMGMADKARLQMYELLFRPKELRHPPVRARLNGQMLAAAAELDALCARTTTPYLFGDRITQVDVSLGCAFTYATETVGLEPPLPALRARAAKLAELPVFREIYLPFDAPAV